MADSLNSGVLADPRPALSAAEVAALGEHLGEDAASVDRRRAACEYYLDTALPDRVNHLWRFTDPAGLLPASLNARILAGADVTPVDLAPVEGAAATIDLWPGRAPVVNVSAGHDPATLMIGALAQGSEAGARSGARPDQSLLFSLLSEAAWNVGLGVEIAPNTVLEGPVHVRVHATGEALVPRITLRVGKGAEATLVEEHLGSGSVVGRTEVQAGAGARVRHVVLQNWGPTGRGYLSIRSRAERDADVLTVFGSFGGDRVKVEMNTVLEGPGSHSEMIGVALGAGRQRCDLHTGHHHRASDTTSNIDFKAVMGGRARSSYTGLIRIDEDAPRTEAFQTNRNLLLNDRARADAIPELEILNEEVSCSHGATVAPVDPDQLFYLESRGLDADESLRLVVRGFLEKTLKSLPAILRPSVEEVVEARLAVLEKSVAEEAD